MGAFYEYNLGCGARGVIDISDVQKNYSVKWGNGALDAQRELLNGCGMGGLFDRRVVVASAFGVKIARVEDSSFSGYDNKGRSRCDGYDGAITDLSNIPIMHGWGDCPWLMVAGRGKIGVVHATRETIDKFVLDHFFEGFFKGIDRFGVKVGFSPFIRADKFSHEYLNLNRISDWENSDAAYKKNGVYHLDLGKMIHAELERLGVLRENIFDAGFDSYKMSERSVKEGGFAVSHRHVFDSGATKEGRGACCIIQTQ